MKELAPGVYVESGYQGTNLGLVVVDDEAIVIDTPMFPDDARKWARRVARAASSVRWVVNTDHHVDRIVGNSLFDAPVVAHENTWSELQVEPDVFLRKQLAALRLDPALIDVLSEHDLVAPQLTLRDAMTFHWDERRIELIALGGHTEASIGVYLPEERLLFAGDVVTVNQHPFMGHANSLEWMRVLERIQRMPVDVLVPGHGSVSDLSAAQKMREYIHTVREEVRVLYLGGSARRETVEKAHVLELFPVRPSELEDVKLRIRAGIERVYAEIRKEEGKRR